MALDSHRATVDWSCSSEYFSSTYAITSSRPVWESRLVRHLMGKGRRKASISMHIDLELNRLDSGSAAISTHIRKAKCAFSDMHRDLAEYLIYWYFMKLPNVGS